MDIFRISLLGLLCLNVNTVKTFQNRKECRSLLPRDQLKVMTEVI